MSARVWAVVLFGSTLVAAAADLAILVVAPRGVAPGEFGFPGYQVVMALSEGVVGFIVATRRSRTPIGWALLVAALAISLSGAVHEYAFATPPGRAGRDLAIWLDAWLWAANTGLTVFAFFRFPDGRPVNPRWRRIEALSLPWIGVGLLLSAFVPGPTLSSGLENPLGLPVLGAIPPAATNAPGVPATLLAAASLVARFRRARGIERQQVKWLAASVALVGSWGLLMVIVQFASPDATALVQSALAVLVPLIPVSIGVAVLRYRLYDIDLLINRTLVYGAVTGTLVAMYAVGVLLFQQLFRPITAGSDLAIAASTLVIAALFQPVRRRIQEAVDRRFYRRKYDAAKTIDAFSGRLRQEIDLDTLSAELLALVGETMRPAGATLWLRERPGAKL